jgi:hypothetical protein
MLKDQVQEGTSKFPFTWINLEASAAGTRKSHLKWVNLAECAAGNRNVGRPRTGWNQ